MKAPTPGSQPQEGLTTPAIQPASVGMEALEEFEATKEARHLAQLEADAELVQRAMWAGYVGKDWNKIARTLVGYGLLVIAAWTRSGRIYKECDSKGYRLEKSPFAREREAAEDLAADCVAVALRKFRDTVLIPGKWDPSRGASLKTYFIGQCVIRFPNVYRRWLGPVKAHAQLRTTEWPEAEADLPLDQGPSRDPATRIANRVYAYERMRALDQETRWILYYRAVEDLSWAEVAELTGLSITQAKSRLHRLQNRARGEST